MPILDLDYRGLLETMDEGFAYCQIIYDKEKAVDFRYLYVNRAFAKQTGLSVEHVVGHTVKEIIPNIEQFWIESYGRVVASGKSNKFENGVLALGKHFEIKVWKCSEGHFAVVFEDITERTKRDANQEDTKQAIMNLMEDLEETKAKDEAMLASLGEGLVAVDTNRKVTVINQMAEKMLGWNREELLGKEITNLPLEDESGNLIPLNKRPTTLALTTGENN